MGNSAIVSAPAPRGLYAMCVFDAPGVVASNNFLSIFNPATSTVSVVIEAIIVSSYSTIASSTPDSLLVQPITAASGGTLQTPSNINRFVNTMPDPIAQVRTGNPTVTLTRQPIAAFLPPISGSAGATTPQSQTPPGTTGAILLPGRGIVLYTLAGNVNQVWNIEVAWAEV